MTDVFISYSRLDRDFVAKLRDSLLAQNQKVWIDWESIPPSQTWWDEIKKGIENANNFAVILSPNSVSSPICHMEIEYARTLNKRIIPVLYEDINREEALKGIGARLALPDQEFTRHLWGQRQPFDLYTANMQALAPINYFFFRATDDFQARFDALLEIILTDYKYKEQHTTLQLRAQVWDQRGRNPSFLLIYDELAQAQQWLTDSTGKEPPPTDLHREYIAASAQRTRQLRNIRRVSVIGSIVAVLAIIFALAASSIGLNAAAQAQSANTQVANANGTLTPIPITLAYANASIKQAKQQAADANTQVANANGTLTPIPVTLNAISTQIQNGQNNIESLRLAALANGLLQKSSANSELAALLAIRALKTGYTPQADAALLQASAQLYTRQIFVDPKSLLEQEEIKSVAVSPNGRTVLSGSNALKLWDVATGELIRVFTGHTGTVTSVAFSPDGRTILSGSDDDTLRLWDVTNGRTIRVFTGHPYASIVNSVAFSPDGRTILSGSDGTTDDPTLIQWDVATGQIVRVFSGHIKSVYSAVFSPDGHLILSGGANDSALGGGTLRLWDVATGKTIRVLTSDNTGDIRRVAFSSDGRTIASSSEVGEIKLWDAISGRVIRVLAGQTDSILNAASLVFSPSGNILATGGPAAGLQFWDVATGQLIRAYGTSSKVNSVAFSPDGQSILSGGYGYGDNLRLWNVSSSRLLSDEHHGDATEVSVSADGRIALSHDLYTIKVWNISTGQLIRIIDTHSDIWKAVLSPDAQTVLLAFNPDSKTEMQLWNISSGQLIRTFSDDARFFSDIAFSPNGRMIASGSTDGPIKLWDAATGQIIRVLTGHLNTVNSLTFSSDGHTLLSGSQDTAALWWDIETGKIITYFNVPFINGDAIYYVDFSPDGLTAIIGHADGTLYAWDTTTRLLLRKFTGHTQGITAIHFSPDSRTMLSSSFDNTLRLWDVATARTIRIFTGGLTDNVISAVLSPDGRSILTGTKDSTVRLWDTNIQDAIGYTCKNVFRDIADGERSQFNIKDHEPTCPQFAGTLLGYTASSDYALTFTPVYSNNPATPMPPTTTAIPDLTLPVWTPIASPTASDTPTDAPTATLTPTATYPGVLLTFTPTGGS